MNLLVTTSVINYLRNINCLYIYGTATAPQCPNPKCFFNISFQSVRKRKRKEKKRKEKTLQHQAANKLQHTTHTKEKRQRHPIKSREIENNNICTNFLFFPSLPFPSLPFQCHVHFFFFPAPDPTAEFCWLSRMAALACLLPPSLGPLGFLFSSRFFFPSPPRRRRRVISASRNSRRNFSAMRSSAAPSLSRWSSVGSGSVYISTFEKKKKS